MCVCVIRLNAPTTTQQLQFRTGVDTRDRAIYDVSYRLPYIIDLYRRRLKDFYFYFYFLFLLPSAGGETVGEIFPMGSLNCRSKPIPPPLVRFPRLDLRGRSGNKFLDLTPILVIVGSWRRFKSYQPAVPVGGRPFNRFKRETGELTVPKYI